MQQCHIISDDDEDNHEHDEVFQIIIPSKNMSAQILFPCLTMQDTLKDLSEPYGFVVRRNDADFRLLVNRAISQLYRSGEEADIFYRWIGRIGIDVPPIMAVMYQLNALPE